jgi:hypothetical protein
MMLWVNERTSAPRSEAAMCQMQSRSPGLREDTVRQLFNLHERIIQHKFNATGIIVYNVDKTTLTTLYKNTGR